MGIEKIRNDFGAVSSTSQPLKKQVKNRIYLSNGARDSVSFTGVGSAAGTATQSLEEILLAYMPKKIKNMVKIHKGMGEIQNQLINAVGTGFIAPLFIKFNPLSDTDEDTRTYTAWRQPVSAALAVGTQAAIVKPFNSIIENMSDTGFLGERYNATLFPSANFIKHQIKENNPDKKFTKEELKNEISKQKKLYRQRLEEMISNDKIEFTTTDLKQGKTVVNKLEMSEENFKSFFDKTLEKIIVEEELEKAKVINAKLPKKTERAIFYHTHSKEAHDVLNRLNENVFKKYTDPNFSNSENELRIISNDFKKECKAIIKDLKKGISKNKENQYVNEQLIKIVQDLRAKDANADAGTIKNLYEKISNLHKEIDDVASLKSTKEVIERVNSIVFSRTAAIDEVISTLKGIKDRLGEKGITVQEAQNIINEKIKESKDLVYNKLKAEGVADKDIPMRKEVIESTAERLKQKAGSVASCIAEQVEKYAKSNIDGYKRWTGLGVSLAILPVTCWLLNRIYPWFMDLAFPNLSNKNKKSDDTVEIQNDKKVEVK